MTFSVIIMNFIINLIMRLIMVLSVLAITLVIAITVLEMHGDYGLRGVLAKINWCAYV